jgi:hypothetical protein
MSTNTGFYLVFLGWGGGGKGVRCVTAVAVRVLLVVGEWLIETERVEDGVRDMVD